MKSLVIGFFFFYGLTSAFAALDLPQGGAVLFCPKEAPVAQEVYENKSRGALPFVFSKEIQAPDKAADIVSRLKKLDPSRANLWQHWAENFYDEASFIPGTFDDIRLGCKTQTVLLRSKKSAINPDRYQIYKNLWESLDEDQKSVLIVHEIVYRDLEQSLISEINYTDARELTHLVFSNASQRLTLNEYIPLLKKLHFNSYKSHGFSLLLNHDLEIQAGHVSSGALSSEENILRPHFAVSCPFATPRSLGRVTLSQDGYLISFEASEELLARPECYPHFYDERIGLFVGHTWLFGNRETPLVIHGLTDQTQELEIDYAFHRFRNGRSASSEESVQPTLYRFDEDFRLREIALGGSACKAATGEVLFVKRIKLAPTSVLLESNGRIQTDLELCP